MTRISALAGVAAIAIMAGMPALSISSAQAQNRGADPQVKPHSQSMDPRGPGMGARGAGREPQALQPRGAEQSGVATQSSTSRSSASNTVEARGGSLNVSVEQFQETLRPEGECVESRDRGQGWEPRGVDNIKLVSKKFVPHRDTADSFKLDV